MADEARSRLGRGLAALIGDVGEESASVERTRSQRRVPIEFLKPNPRNPRRKFAEAELEELTASVRERGVIQPILVRSARGTADQYEIVAGERPLAAPRNAPGLHDVPIVLLEVSDREAPLELAIIENVQRADLNALEEAGGYQALIDEFKHSQDDIGKIVGKSRSHIANTLRLFEAARHREGAHQFRQAVGRSRSQCWSANRDAERLAEGDRRAWPERTAGGGACA